MKIEVVNQAIESAVNVKNATAVVGYSLGAKAVTSPAIDYTEPSVYFPLGLVIIIGTYHILLIIEKIKNLIK